MKNFILPILLSLLIISCDAKKSTENTDDLISFNIIQINDVYEIDAINAGKNGGLARVAYIRDSIKKENPNTFYFLAGDFVNPSLIGTIKYEGERLQGRQMIEVLNASELDLVTFGNHEFDIKEPDLQKRLNESNFKWTSANVLQAGPEEYRPFQIEKNGGITPVSDYEIFTVKNDAGKEVKFGVFGVTIPSNPQAHVYYKDIYEEAERAYKLAANESDFVIGLTHLSLEQDKELAKRIPEIPLIMGGHEHFNMKVEVGNTVITKADANVLSIYLHSIQYNTKTKEYHIDSKLIEVTDVYPSSAKVQPVVDKWIKVLEDNLKTLIDNPNEIIYNAIEPFDGTDDASRSEQTNLGLLICKSMAYAYNNEVEGAIFNGGGIRIDDMVEGEITSKDIFRILPFGGSVFTAELTGELLIEVLDYGVSASGTGAYLQRYNFEQTEDGWLIGGVSIDKSKVYKIVLNDYLMLGLDVPFLTPEHPGVIDFVQPKSGELAADIRNCIIEYIKSND